MVSMLKIRKERETDAAAAVIHKKQEKSLTFQPIDIVWYERWILTLKTKTKREFKSKKDVEPNRPK